MEENEGIEISATRPIPKSPWNKSDMLIAKCLKEWMGWNKEDIEGHAKKWWDVNGVSNGTLNGITQENIKAFNKYLRNRIIEQIGEDGLDEYINESFKKEGIVND